MEKALPQCAIDGRTLAYKKKMREAEEERKAKEEDEERAEQERRDKRRKEAELKLGRIREQKGDFCKYKPTIKTTTKPTLKPKEPEKSNGAEWEKAKEKAIKQKGKG